MLFFRCFSNEREVAMDKIKILLMTVMVSLLCGCGHNIAVYSKGVGVEIAWRPNTIMPSLRFGSYENLDLVQKENNQVRYTSNNGAGFNWFGLRSLISGDKSQDIGMGTVLEVKTGPQINGYAADVLMNPEVKKEHVQIAKAITGVEMDLGDKEVHVGLGEVKANTTPVVTTEKGFFGNSKVTTPANEYTVDAIKEQVKTTNLPDLLKAYGLYITYICCGIVLVFLGLAFVIVHLLQKTQDLKEMIKDIRGMTGR